MSAAKAMLGETAMEWRSEVPYGLPDWDDATQRANDAVRKAQDDVLNARTPARLLAATDRLAGARHVFGRCLSRVVERRRQQRAAS